MADEEIDELIPFNTVDEWIRVCTECHSDHAHPNPKWPDGMQPCSFCGGKTKDIPADNAKIRRDVLAREDSKRGLYRRPETEDE